MMPVFPRSPLTFRTAGFPDTAERQAFQAGPFQNIVNLSLLPACTEQCLVCLRPSRTSWSTDDPALCRGEDSILRRRGGCLPFAPGALAPVRFMLSGPSSLNRPHPPHSRAHRDFTAKRLIRDAFAVRERRGGPRVVPSFHYHSFLACRPLRPRGARSSLCPVPRCRHGPSPRVERLGAPKYPAIRFTRELVFVALRFASATACQVARPPVRI